MMIHYELFLLIIIISEMVEKTARIPVCIAASANFGKSFGMLPAGKHTKSGGFNGKSHYTWPFSMAILTLLWVNQLYTSMAMVANSAFARGYIVGVLVYNHNLGSWKLL